MNDPGGVLKNLSKKLAPGGKLFIDTPKQFWLYPVLKEDQQKPVFKIVERNRKPCAPSDMDEKSFVHVVDEAGLKLEKYEELSEFTLKPHLSVKWA